VGGDPGGKVPLQISWSSKGKKCGAVVFFSVASLGGGRMGGEANLFRRLFDLAEAQAGKRKETHSIICRGPVS